MLTFVDMSKLKYLSRSVNANSKLSRKKAAPVVLPKNTSSAIAEAASEEDSDESPSKVPIEEDSPSLPKTGRDFALEVINELIDIVFESVE